MSKYQVYVVTKDDQLSKCLHLRYVVFGIEHKIPKCEEYDQFDELGAACTHFICELEEKTVGTCRLRVASAYLQLERVAVDVSFRSSGVGRALCEAAFLWSRKNYPAKLVQINADVPAIKFWEKLGMVTVSDVFYEAKIAHYLICMILPPTDPKAVDDLEVWGCDSVSKTQREKLRVLLNKQ